MSTTVGRVDFLVDFDGKKLPAQARKIGREVGTAMGRQASEGFDLEMSGVAQRLKNQMTKDGDFLGTTFSKALRGALVSQRGDLTNTLASIFTDRGAFNDFVSDADNVGEGVARVTALMEKLRNEGGLTWNEFQSLSKTTKEWSHDLFDAEHAVNAHKDALVDLNMELDRNSDAYREVNKRFSEYQVEIDKQHGLALRMDKDFDKMTKRLHEQSKAANEDSFSWKDLSHNLRQAILIVAAIAAGSGEIAVLGSAAGAGLTILGGAAVTAGVGLGVLIAALKGVNGDLKDLPAGAREGVAALQELGKGFSAIQDSIQSAFFKDLAAPLENLTANLLPTLNAGLTGIADVLGTSFGDLFNQLASPAAQKVLSGIFDDMAIQLPILVQIIGDIGAAFGNVLDTAGPFVTQFLADLQNLTEQFRDFTSSAEGKNEIQEWFANGERVIRSFNKLLGAAGKLLANLVTPQTVNQTTEFLDNLAGMMPFLQDLLEVFTQLDIFGLIAQLLNDVGNALKPVLDLLEPIATMLNAFIQLIIVGLANAMDGIGVILQPFILGFQIMSYLLTPIIQYITELGEAMGELLGPLDGIANSIFEGVKPALDDLLAAFFGVIPTPKELARIINEELLPRIQEFANWVSTKGIQVVDDLAQVMEDLFLTIEDVVSTKAKLDTFVSKVEQLMHELARAIQDPIGEFVHLLDLAGQFSMGNGNNFTVGQIPHAAGGILNASTFLGSNHIAGESGPEAIVPLMRDLNQVDPSVRFLSAVAQGKAGMGAGKQINVASGAILVNGVEDPEQAASAVLDRLVAVVGG